MFPTKVPKNVVIKKNYQKKIVLKLPDKKTKHRKTWMRSLRRRMKIILTNDVNVMCLPSEDWSSCVVDITSIYNNSCIYRNISS